MIIAIKSSDVSYVSWIYAFLWIRISISIAITFDYSWSSTWYKCQYSSIYWFSFDSWYSKITRRVYLYCKSSFDFYPILRKFSHPLVFRVSWLQTNSTKYRAGATRRFLYLFSFASLLILWLFAILFVNLPMLNFHFAQEKCPAPPGMVIIQVGYCLLLAVGVVVLFMLYHK